MSDPPVMGPLPTVPPGPQGPCSNPSGSEYSWPVLCQEMALLLQPCGETPPRSSEESTGAGLPGFQAGAPGSQQSKWEGQRGRGAGLWVPGSLWCCSVHFRRRKGDAGSSLCRPQSPSAQAAPSSGSDAAACMSGDSSSQTFHSENSSAM